MGCTEWSSRRSSKTFCATTARGTSNSSTSASRWSKPPKRPAAPITLPACCSAAPLPGPLLPTTIDLDRCFAGEFILLPRHFLFKEKEQELQVSGIAKVARITCVWAASTVSLAVLVAPDTAAQDLASHESVLHSGGVRGGRDACARGAYGEAGHRPSDG